MMERSITDRTLGFAEGQLGRRDSAGTAKSRALKVKAYGLTDRVPHEAFANLPDFFLHSGCKMVKSEEKIKIVRLAMRLDRTIRSVYIKQHNAFFLRRLASFFWPSAAVRALRGAAILLQEGYGTALPVAAVEYRRWGVLLKSFYLSEEIEGAKTVSDYWREDLPHPGRESRIKRRALLRQLARLFKSLHDRAIYHNDLKAANILIAHKNATLEESLALIDLQGVRKCLFLSKRRRIKNLGQINRTLGLELTRTEKLFFINEYAGERLKDRKSKRLLIRSILTETRRQIIREQVRHPACGPELIATVQKLDGEPTAAPVF
jgi:serine/threonine protein kinase